MINIRTTMQMFILGLITLLPSACVASPKIEQQILEDLLSASPTKQAEISYKGQYFRFYKLDGYKTTVPGAENFMQCYKSVSSMKQKYDLDANLVSYMGDVPWLGEFDKNTIEKIVGYVSEYNKTLEDLLIKGGWDLCDLIGR